MKVWEQRKQSWGRLRVLVAFRITWALLLHRIEFSCQKWIYSFSHTFSYKIILNLFQQVVWTIQFCYELMKIHHQPMIVSALSLFLFEAWVQATAAFMSKVRRANRKSSSAKMKTWPLLLQRRVANHSRPYSSPVTFPSEEPFLPSERCVNACGARHSLALISSGPTG